MAELENQETQDETPRVLILCTHNSARSQMAEGLLRHRAVDRFEVHSAGLEPTEVHPLAIAALAEMGIDISGQRSKSSKQYLGHMSFEHLIIVCARAEEQCPRIFPGVAHIHSWPFDDPAAEEGSAEACLAAFRAVRDQIDERLTVWLHELDAAAARPISLVAPPRKPTVT